jgi:hypothetical protein
VRVVQQGKARALRLVAGAAMNGPIPGMALPHVPAADSPDAAFHLLDCSPGFAARALGGAWDPSAMEGLERLTVTTETPVTVELLDRPRAWLFADEDPFLAHRRWLVELAGVLPFVPGNSRFTEVP